jgi:hypothetical protein
VTRRLALLLPLLTAGGPCGPSVPSLPPADVCDEPVTPRAPLTVEIGGHEDPFVPWSDGAVARTVQGGQGSDMIALRARLTGADVPACVRVSVSLVRDGSVTGARLANLSTYPVSGGARATMPLFIELTDADSGDEIEVDAEIAGAAIARRVHLDVRAGTCDEMRARWLELRPALPAACGGDLDCVVAGASAFVEDCACAPRLDPGCGAATRAATHFGSEADLLERVFADRCAGRADLCSTCDAPEAGCAAGRCEVVTPACPGR